MGLTVSDLGRGGCGEPAEHPPKEGEARRTVLAIAWVASLGTSAPRVSEAKREHPPSETSGGDATQMTSKTNILKAVPVLMSSDYISYK